jgi:hypothetical protein
MWLPNGWMSIALTKNAIYKYVISDRLSEFSSCLKKSMLVDMWLAIWLHELSSPTKIPPTQLGYVISHWLSESLFSTLKKMKIQSKLIFGYRFYFFIFDELENIVKIIIIISKPMKFISIFWCIHPP